MSHADTAPRGTSALGGAVGGLLLLLGFLLSEQALGPCGQRCAMASPPLARHAGIRHGTGRRGALVRVVLATPRLSTRPKGDQIC